MSGLSLSARTAAVAQLDGQLPQLSSPASGFEEKALPVFANERKVPGVVNQVEIGRRQVKAINRHGALDFHFHQSIARCRFSNDRLARHGELRDVHARRSRIHETSIRAGPGRFNEGEGPMPGRLNAISLFKVKLDLEGLVVVFVGPRLKLYRF